MSILSNNRFLQRVNPEIARARTDAGASLVSDHAVIQPLMRNMVDLGIIDNLKLWVHSGLVDTRTSGSDLFVPKAYDISGEENDAVQATTGSQPELVNNGMKFDGSNDFISIGHDNIYNPEEEDFSVLVWHYLDTNAANRIINKGNYSSFFNGWRLVWAADTVRAYIADLNSTAASSPGQAEVVISLNTSGWYLFSLVINRTSNNLFCYINTSFDSADISALDTINPTDDIMIGRRALGAVNNYGIGTTGDIRIFNTALSASQITSIYNATKGYYGIT